MDYQLSLENVRRLTIGLGISDGRCWATSDELMHSIERPTGKWESLSLAVGNRYERNSIGLEYLYNQEAVGTRLQQSFLGKDRGEIVGVVVVAVD